MTARIAGALADGSWGKYHGPHVAELTDVLTRYHQTDYAILCSSGTAAVELALRGLAIGPGDEVLLSAYDFKANFQNVLALGAAPVLVDIVPHSAAIDGAALAAAAGPKGKAIIASHLHGGVVDMPALMGVAHERQLAVVEDAAQMPGARVYGRAAGTWGDVGILSFGGSKLVTAGRGGAVLTSRAAVAQRIKLHTQRGNDAYPLSELQAAAIIPQWARLDETNGRRTAAVAWLNERLSRIRGLTTFGNQPSDSMPGYYKLGFYYDPAAFAGLPRDGFAAALRAEGIALDRGFRGLHKTHSSRRFRAVDGLPNATRADDCVLTLHHPVLLGSEQDLAQVVAAIERVNRNAAAIRERLIAQPLPIDI